MTRVGSGPLRDPGVGVIARQNGLRGVDYVSFATKKALHIRLRTSSVAACRTAMYIVTPRFAHDPVRTRSGGGRTAILVGGRDMSRAADRTAGRTPAGTGTAGREPHGRRRGHVPVQSGTGIVSRASRVTPLE